jgi:hypothetical protein
MIQSAHIECDVGGEGDATLVATTLLDVERRGVAIDAAKQAAAHKVCKARVGGLSKVRVEKLSMESEAIASQKQP